MTAHVFDLTPMVELAERSAAIVARIDVGETVKHAEVRAIEADVHAFCDRLLAAMATAGGNRAVAVNSRSEMDDGMAEAVYILTGAGDVGMRWDESPAALDEQCAHLTARALERGEDPDDIAMYVARLRSDGIPPEEARTFLQD